MNATCFFNKTYFHIIQNSNSHAYVKQIENLCKTNMQRLTYHEIANIKHRLEFKI